jgi:hypothetical protein
LFSHRSEAQRTARVRVASSLAAAALDGLFEHPAGYSGTIAIREIAAPYLANTEFFRSLLGVCPSNPSLRGEGAAGRCEAAGSKKPEAYPLEYVEDFFGPRRTQTAADHSPQ